MHKRVLLLVAAFLLLLSGCDMWRPATPGTPQADMVDAEKYLTSYENNWQFRYLDDNSRLRYGAIYTVLTDTFDRDETVTIGEKSYDGVRVPMPVPIATEKEAETLYNAFFRDNPEFFYVGGHYELEGYMQEGAPRYDTLVLVYTMDAEERTTAREELTQAVSEIVAGKPDTTDEYLTELYLHDTLAARCTYSDKAASAGSYAFPDAFNAYGALVEGEAVCEGYSRGMQLLLKECGIDSTLVIGRSLENDEDHMWNLVTINGRNYFLDATWNDSGDRLRHTYFNLSSALLERTHTIADGQVGIDSCTVLNDNYFSREDAFVNTYDRDVIAEKIAKAYIAGDTVIELRFAPDMYDNGLLFLKNQKLTHSMVKNFLSDGQPPLWEYELTGDDVQYILTLTKK